MALDAALGSTLTAAAVDAAARAYAPYSRFAVGAALLLDDGAVVTGGNVENASYGLTSCAERNALFRAIAERGPGARVRAVAVFHDGPEACPPCGACLQVLSEFAAPECEVFFSEGPGWQRYTFAALLPARFARTSL